MKTSEKLRRIGERFGIDAKTFGQWANEVATLEAEVAIRRQKTNKQLDRLTLHCGIVGDYDGAYDWVDRSEFDNPDYSAGDHPGIWGDDGYIVVEVAEQEQE